MTGEEIDKSVRQELMSLPRTLAVDVARNLVMVARLLDEDPERAYAYSRVALRLASRVGAVREAAGFAAYGVEKYGEALTEFRAARRMTGSVHLWPIMADCERGIGRPERALAMAGAPEVRQLDKAGQVEMRLVAAGARRDMGQAEAAVVTLQSPELASHSVQPWTARLRYAYADALLAVGRREEAREWFARALEADQGGVTNASDRLAELDGVAFIDALDPNAEDEYGEDEFAEEYSREKREEEHAEPARRAGDRREADPGAARGRGRGAREDHDAERFRGGRFAGRGDETEDFGAEELDELDEPGEFGEGAGLGRAAARERRFAEAEEPRRRAPADDGSAGGGSREARENPAAPDESEAPEQGRESATSGEAGDNGQSGETGDAGANGGANDGESGA